jgi:hypothetical protein
VDTVGETVIKAENPFATVENLQAEFPKITLSTSWSTVSWSVPEQ